MKPRLTWLRMKLIYHMMSERSWHKHRFLVWQCMPKGCAGKITQSSQIAFCWGEEKTRKPLPGWKVFFQPSFLGCLPPWFGSPTPALLQLQTYIFSFPQPWTLIFQRTATKGHQALHSQSILPKPSLLVTATFPLQPKLHCSSFAFSFFLP